MKYDSVYLEYTQYVDEKFALLHELETLPSGYISVKTINGGQHHYLQKRQDNTVKSDYIKPDEEQLVREQLARRVEIQDRMKQLDDEIARLEKAMKVLSPALLQRSQFYKQGAAADNLPLEEREKAVRFSSAMTALEGLETSDETESFMNLWVKGEASLQSFYLSLLEKYQVIEETR